MHTTFFINSVLTVAILALYIMAMRANHRAMRAEVALCRVEAVIADVASDNYLDDLVAAAERALDTVEVSK